MAIRTLIFYKMYVEISQCLTSYKQTNERFDILCFAFSGGLHLILFELKLTTPQG